MRTITLELPEDVASQLDAVPVEQRNRYAIAALVYGMEYLTPEDAEALDADRAGCVKAVEEAFADIEAGRAYSLEEEMVYWQQMKARLRSPSSNQSATE